MGLFDKLFSFGQTEESNDLKEMPPSFGRYSDNNKTAFQLEEWKKAKKLYDEKKYSESIVHFFTYLRDSSINNVIFEPNGDNVRFTIYQGSKEIMGSIDDNSLKAEVTVAKMIKRSVPVMRQLLERNFELYYSKFFLEDDKIKLKVYNNVIAAAPDKLYFALKELTIQADKLDDILVDDFEALESEGTGHIEILNDDIKQIKYNFFKLWLDKTINKVEELDAVKYAGGITYMLLNLIYKLDYLLLPEGKLTESIEEVNSMFWNFPKEMPAAERNHHLLKELKVLQNWAEDDVKKYFYRTKHTFSLTEPISFGKVVETITLALQNVGWFRENDQDYIALEILEYALAYSQFSFSLPKPVTQLFDILMQVNHAQYYKDSGFTEEFYNPDDMFFQKDEIIRKINNIITENKERYTLINLDVSQLDFTDLLSFNYTLLMEVQKLDLGKKK